MTDTSAQLKVLLETQGNPEERIKTLSEYAEYLQEPAVLLYLNDYITREESSSVRKALLRILVAARSGTLHASEHYEAILLSSLAGEVEPELRRWAAKGLADMVSTRQERAQVLVEALIWETDESVQKICAEALAGLPRLPDDVLEALVGFIQWAPSALYPVLLSAMDKADSAVWKEKAAIKLLRTTVPDQERQRAVSMLQSLPALSAESCAYLSDYVAFEPNMKVVADILEKLFRQSGVTRQQTSKALELTLKRGPEAQAAMALFAFKMHTHPEILNSFKTIIENHEDVYMRLTALYFLKDANIFEIWEIAFHDPDALVREWAIGMSGFVLEAQPQRFMQLLLSIYAKESQWHIRRTIIAVLETQPRLVSTLEIDSFLPLFEERDILLRRSIAVLSLHLPFDRAHASHKKLADAWVDLLGDATIDASTRWTLLEKLEQMDYQTHAGLDEALKAVMQQIRTFDELNTYYPRLKKFVHDPKFLLPQMMQMLERFAGHFPAGALNDILILIKEYKGQVPEVASRLPYLLKLTNDTTLLSHVTETEQKDHLFPAILNHCMIGEFSEAVQLIRQGFENSTLRKSEVTKLYRLSLSHPELYELSQELISIMRTVNLVSAETVDISFDFLTTFAMENTSTYNVSEYLTAVGAQLPDFDARYVGLLTDEAYQQYVRQHTDPRGHSTTLRRPVEWHDSDNWQVAYPTWTLFSKLEKKSRLEWLRAHAQDPINMEKPQYWSTALFALNAYRQENKLEIADLSAIGACYRHAVSNEHGRYIADRAACLFTQRWNRWEMTSDTLAHMPAELIETATEIFLSQVQHWLSVGGLEYHGRVKPMRGISLDHFKKKWSGTTLEWNAFWQGYAETFGVNGLEIIPPEPNTKVRPSPHFERLYAGGGNSPHQVLEFLFLTPPPSKDDGEFYQMWRKMIWTASKKLQKVYADCLANMDTPTKQRVSETLAAG